MQFIEEMKNRKDGCFLCELQQKGDDRERLILCRGEHSYIVMNRYPYNNGHLLISPYRHTGSLKDLSKEERQEIMGLAGESVEIMSKAMEAEGFNLGFNLGKAAGAGVVDHVHLHVVPRWVGDTNFLPIMSDTRSMPEYLHSTYDRLVGGFRGIKA